MIAACPYYDGDFLASVTITPNDGKISHDSSTNTLSWGPTSGFNTENSYTAVIKGPMDGSNSYKYTITMTLNVYKLCNSLSYTPSPLSKAIMIDGINPSSSSSFSYGTFLTGAATDCLIRYSYQVKNSASTDVTAALASFVTISPASNLDTTTGIVTVSVASSTDTSLIAGSPYTVTVIAKLTKDLT